MTVKLISYRNSLVCWIFYCLGGMDCLGSSLSGTSKYTRQASYYTTLFFLSRSWRWDWGWVCGGGVVDEEDGNRRNQRRACF